MIHHRAWPVFVLAICAVGVTGTATLIVFATRDSTFAVEPDYYAKGLAWDDAARQRAVNERLAWRAHAAISNPVGPDAPHVLTVTLRDEDDAPIDDAAVRAVVFPHTDARRRATLDLHRRSLGQYEGPLPSAREGMWRIRLVVTRAETSFTAELDAHAAANASTAQPPEAMP